MLSSIVSSCRLDRLLFIRVIRCIVTDLLFCLQFLFASFQLFVVFAGGLQLLLTVTLHSVLVRVQRNMLHHKPANKIRFNF